MPTNCDSETCPCPPDSATGNRGTILTHWDEHGGPARGHKYILVDYATRYPEAIPLQRATPAAIAQELFALCSRMGIPSKIFTDQGTPFVSRVMADLFKLLRVKHLRNSVYQPQTDGVVERFN